VRKLACSLRRAASGIKNKRTVIAFVPLFSSCKKWVIDYLLAEHQLVGFSMKKGKGPGGLARGERLQIMLSHNELRVVDSFRFQHRMPSRAAAVRELFRLGIAAAGVVVDNAGIKSSDYGVLKAPKNLTKLR
jgi:hypothetical protein